MTIEIERNTWWKQSGNIWHCRKTTFSQFLSSSLWLWWDLEAWLGMAWQALALKVALATLMECMWHTRCLGDWTVVKCDEKPFRNHMVQFNTIFARRATSKHWKPVSFGCYFGSDSCTCVYIGYPKKATFWSSGHFVDCPKNSRIEALRHVGSFAAFFSFLEVEVKQICFCSLHISTNQNYNDMWIYDSYYSHDSYAFFWPLLNFITQENVQTFHHTSC